MLPERHHDDENETYYDEVGVLHHSRPVSKKAFPSIFQMQLTPQNPVINPVAPLEMTLKCMAKENQEVVIQMNSFLYKILDPRAKCGLRTDIYRVMVPGETISFHIGVLRDTPKGVLEKDLAKSLKTPEGTFTIFHETTEKKSDAEADWGRHKEYTSITDTEVPWKDGEDILIHYSTTEYVEHGRLDVEFVCNPETELIKNRKKLFWLTVKKVKQEEKKQEELRKERERRNKKCCPCTIM